MIDFGLFGLTRRDQRVYEALLHQPHASIRSVAEATSINRGSVYESLKALMRVGLVSYIETGKSVRYAAERPEKLREVLNEQRRKLSEARDDIDAYARSILPGEGRTDALQFASFYDGDEGLANILRDVLATCRLQHIDSYRVISSPKVSEYLYNNFKHFTRERIKQGLFVQILRQGAAVRGEAILAEWRMMPERVQDTRCYTLIYGTKVAIASIDELNHTSGIIIDNPGVARTHSMMFDMVWQGLEDDLVK